MNILDKLETKLQRVKRYDHYLSALCPFHDDNSPSLLVYKDLYICKSCGAKGKPEELLDKVDISFRPQPISYSYSNPFNDWLSEMDLSTLCERSAKLLVKYPYMGTYLHDREIDQELIEKVGIGYRDDWFIFPVRDKEKNVIGAVARSGRSDAPVRYYVPYGQEPMLYCPNWNRLEASRSIVLVYGIVDSVSLERIGLASITGTLGKKINPSLLDNIRKRIYILPDNGEEKEANILASKLGWRGYTINVNYPYNTKDPNDLLQRGKLREIINGLEFGIRDSGRTSDRERVIT